MTALHHASLCNNIMAVRALVRGCKADPDVLDSVRCLLQTVIVLAHREAYAVVAK